MAAESTNAQNVGNTLGVPEIWGAGVMECRSAGELGGREAWESLAGLCPSWCRLTWYFDLRIERRSLSGRIGPRFARSVNAQAFLTRCRVIPNPPLCESTGEVRDLGKQDAWTSHASSSRQPGTADSHSSICRFWASTCYG